MWAALARARRGRTALGSSADDQKRRVSGCPSKKAPPFVDRRALTIPGKIPSVRRTNRPNRTADQQRRT